jgi:hypothetical protein
VSGDPQKIVDGILPYVKLGFNHLVFHAPGPHQARFLDLFAGELAKARIDISNEAPLPPGCRGLIITFIIVVVVFLVVAVASGWVHITKVGP